MGDRDKQAFEDALKKQDAECILDGFENSFNVWVYYFQNTQAAWVLWQAALAHRDAQPVGAQAPAIKEKQLEVVGRIANELGVRTTDAYRIIAAYTSSAPPADVVRELVEALNKAEEAMTWELGGEPCGLETALIAVSAALNKAKEHGL